MTETWPARSAYLRPAVLERWDDSRLSRWADDAAAAGVTAAVTKLDMITPERRARLGAHGIAMLGSFSCYSDHRHPDDLDGGIRPVGRDGRPLAPLEWYTGLVPGSPRFDDALAARLATEARAAETDWVLLDFLRWPGHWEIESRGAGRPRDSSFDPDTLARFAETLGRAEASVAEVDAHPAEWQAFRVATVAASARRLAAVVREAGARPGMFLVPIAQGRRIRDYGQDVAALSLFIDLFALMSYQQMLGITGAGIAALADEVRLASSRPVVAMVQTTAAVEFSDGWDWGPPIDADDVTALSAEMDAAVLDGRIAGTCFFPGEAPLPHSDRIRDTTEGRS